MTITKLGHCCLLIEDNGRRVLTDPGMWSTAQNEVTGIDLILITHEHFDHFHLESLQKVLVNNPQAQVITNSRVKDLLAEKNIPATLLEHEQQKTIAGFDIAGFGKKHATIYPSIPPVMNTGFLLQQKFFYPGDALTNPGVPVEIVALPMIGPWMKLAEALDWARELRPAACVPVHDGMLTDRDWIYALPGKLLPEWGTRFDALELGNAIDYP